MKRVWVTRNPKSSKVCIWVCANKPQKRYDFKSDKPRWWVRRDALFITAYYKAWKELTGITVRAGECKAVRMSFISALSGDLILPAVPKLRRVANG